MLTSILFPLALSTVLAAEPTSYSAKLELKARLLDAEGSRKLGMMYMPSSAKLSEEKPALVKKEPKYHGKPRYVTLTIGNGPSNQFVVAFDEAEGQDALIYPDANGNGDLTDDGAGEWPVKTPGKEGASAQYAGTWVFHTTYKGKDGAVTKGDYGLNFYRSPDRETVNYYRSSARTGKINVNGKDYEVMLLENDNDGVFNKPVDPHAPMIAGAPMGKPVWLALDGGRFDIRETFGFADLNFEASVNDDGSELTLKPTMKTVRLPRVAEKTPILEAGKMAPDFEAMLWKNNAETAFKLSDLKGKVVVIDMWATWCGPCRASLPHLSKIAEATKDQGVVVMALNVYDEKAAYDRFVKETEGKYAFQLARDQGGREREASLAKRLFNVSAIPATYVIDRQGKIIAAISGYTEGDKQIEAALKTVGVKID